MRHFFECAFCVAKLKTYAVERQIIVITESIVRRLVYRAVWITPPVRPRRKQY